MMSSSSVKMALDQYAASLDRIDKGGGRARAKIASLRSSPIQSRRCLGHRRHKMLDGAMVTVE